MNTIIKKNYIYFSIAIIFTLLASVGSIAIIKVRETLVNAIVNTKSASHIY